MGESPMKAEDYVRSQFYFQNCEARGLTTVAHGPIVRDEGHVPRRVVLMDKGDEFVVWEECFNEDVPDAARSKHYYHQGQYFPYAKGGTVYGRDDRAVALRSATSKFLTRLNRVDRLGLVLSSPNPFDHDAVSLVAIPTDGLDGYARG